MGTIIYIFYDILQWDDYSNKPVIFIDDIISFSEMENILNWADRGSFRAEIKGGHILIRPKVIICTSNMSIKQICE